ncbi:unnamed protein product [Hyaloperonospora brassicae]|uniref:Uncharacterized protein n=1 Tax=Hyaloperonospora brassicae TaxID=162125 RepID=A0AAV0TEN2_HYABA|nr:unnamed protein product [Hyaloperonospora brassicae]
MSTCPQCYTGTCKRHKRQDHGKSLIKSADAGSTLQKMYDQLVGFKLQKLEAEAKRDPSSHHTTAYRKQLDASRDKSMHSTHERRSQVTSSDGTGSGLNPQAFAAINDWDSDVSDDDRRSRKKKKKEKTAKKEKEKKEKKTKKTKKKEKCQHVHESMGCTKRRRRSDSSDDSGGSDANSRDSYRTHQRSSSDQQHPRYAQDGHEKKKSKRS